MPVITLAEEQGFEDHVAATGNPHGTKLSDIATPDTQVSFGDQAILDLAAIVGDLGNVYQSFDRAGEKDVLVPGDGSSDHTFDVTLTNNYFTHLVVHIVGINQEDASQMYRKVDVLMSCTGGTAKIIGDQPEQDRNAADAGSIFEGDDSPYGEPSATSNKLRITLPAHATDAVKYSITVDAKLTAYPV